MFVGFLDMRLKVQGLESDKPPWWQWTFATRKALDKQEENSGYMRMYEESWRLEMTLPFNSVTVLGTSVVALKLF